MFDKDIVVEKDDLNELMVKIQELLDFSNEKEIPVGLVWGLLSFGFSKVAMNA